MIEMAISKFKFWTQKHSFGSKSFELIKISEEVFCAILSNVAQSKQEQKT